MSRHHPVEIDIISHGDSTPQQTYMEHMAASLSYSRPGSIVMYERIGESSSTGDRLFVQTCFKEGMILPAFTYTRDLHPALDKKLYITHPEGVVTIAETKIDYYLSDMMRMDEKLNGKMNPYPDLSSSDNATVEES